MSRWLERTAMVIACTSLLLAGLANATEVSDEGYPAQPRQAGTPTSPDQDLNDSFPKRDSLIPQLRPQNLPDFKRKLYEDYGLKLGVERRWGRMRCGRRAAAAT
jgi:hypothetical protein